MLAKQVRLDVYCPGQNNLIEQLIRKFPPVVATLEAVPDEVVAWTCREVRRPITHFVYVKFAFRRLGIGSALAVATDFYSHQTKAGELLARRIGALYDPFTLFPEPT